MSAAGAHARVLAAGAVLVLALAACGETQHHVALRHVPKSPLRYELRQHEEAPHPDFGYGGTLDVTSTVTLSCLEVEPAGLGHFEVAVEHVKVAGPPAMGLAVDTRAGRPIPEDKIGAGSVARALLPRTALLRISPRGEVLDAIPDAEVGKHVTDWLRNKPLATRRGILRLREALDPGQSVAVWWTLFGDLVPSGAVPHGARWSVSTQFPTPGGDVSAAMDLIHRREGDLSVIEGRGPLALAGDAPNDAPATFEKGTLARILRIDTARGVLHSYEEVRDMAFRLRGRDGARATWLHRMELRLIE